MNTDKKYFLICISSRICVVNLVQNAWKLKASSSREQQESQTGTGNMFSQHFVLSSSRMGGLTNGRTDGWVNGLGLEALALA